MAITITGRTGGGRALLGITIGNHDHRIFARKGEAIIAREGEAGGTISSERGGGKTIGNHHHRRIAKINGGGSDAVLQLLPSCYLSTCSRLYSSY